MSATNKTSFLGLSSWLGSDKPQRTDFNSDNQKIDEFASGHTADLQTHLSEADREKFDTPYYMGVYYGNGQSSRTISTGCPFEPELAIVFCIGSPVQQTDFSGECSYCYFGLAAKRGGMSGVSLSGKNLVVGSSTAAVAEDEYTRMNEIGETYFYFLLR